MFDKPVCLRKTAASVIAVLVIFMAVSMGLIVGEHSIKQLKQDEGRMLAEVARQMVDRLQATMRFRATEVNTLALLPSITNPDQARILVDALQKNDQWVAWSGVVDIRGKVIAGSNGVLQDQDISARPVYSQGLKNGSFIGDVHEAMLLDRLLRKPGDEPMRFVDVSREILVDGKQWGVFAIHFNWIWANSIVKSLLEPINDMPALEILVIATDNTVLLGPKALLGTKLTVPSSNMPHNGTGGWLIESWPGEGEYITGWANESGGSRDKSNLGWTVLAKQPVGIAFKSADEIRDKTIVFGIALAVMFSIAGWVLVNRITEPLIKITTAANKLSQGSLVDIPHITWAKELKTLSESLITMVESLTNQKRALVQMTTIADHDKLTGLPNRRQMEQHLQRLKGTNQTVYILYMDLDGFKPVNDTWGHDTGDQVLQAIAIGLKQCLRHEDLPVRLGGDEFVVVMQPNCTKETSSRVANRIIAKLQEPIIIEEKQINIGCSVGMSCWDTDKEAASVAMERADQALYSAKKTGKNKLVEA